MRKLILSMQVSLDGYIEGANKDTSWLNKEDDEQWQDLFEMLKTVDLFILGRGMWDDYRNYWKMVLQQPSPVKNEIDYARLAERTRHLVYSNTRQDTKWENATILSGPLAEGVAKLKHEPGGDIQIVGGARMAAGLIDAGLVDEYRIIVNPFIVGGGKSFFQQVKGKHALRFLGSKTFKTGVTVLRYGNR